MDKQVIKKILNSHGLKSTMPRMEVLEVFFLQTKAISFGQLLKATKKTVNRVTIYRTLHSLEEIGLIQRIAGPNHNQQYALSFSEKDHLDLSTRQHLYFSCVRCRTVSVLDRLNIPFIPVPESYLVQAINLTVTGICENCNLQGDTSVSGRSSNR